MSTLAQTNPVDGVDQVVRRRYAAGAERVERDLCCPVEYDERLLELIPPEIVEKDYGCGDPSRWVSQGQTVLDLGSGTGKNCYMLSQIVGPQGRVIGVDFNEPMLTVARNHQAEFARRLGYDNMEFRKGRIQDLRLDLDRLDAWLKARPVDSADAYLAVNAQADRLRAAHPLVPDESVDVVVSNCVLNLVPRPQRQDLFAEMHRVLRRGGHCVISDITSDEEVPAALQKDPHLWSGCISGAFLEDELPAALEQAGFYGAEILARAEKPWQILEGVEFRSMTVRAYKGKEGPCLERNQAVIYRGPFKAVIDDDGHTLYRGRRMAVCDKTFRIYTREPYADRIIAVPPHEEVPVDQTAPFDCQHGAVRPARRTKGADYRVTDYAPDRGCCDNSDCC